MYTLTKPAIEALKDKDLRRKVASNMGVGEQSVWSSISYKQGRSLASNYDAMITLQNHLNLPINQLRCIQK